MACTHVTVSLGDSRTVVGAAMFGVPAAFAPLVTGFVSVPDCAELVVGDVLAPAVDTLVFAPSGFVDTAFVGDGGAERSLNNAANSVTFLNAASVVVDWSLSGTRLGLALVLSFCPRANTIATSPSSSLSFSDVSPLLFLSVFFALEVVCGCSLSLSSEPNSFTRSITPSVSMKSSIIGAPLSALRVLFDLVLLDGGASETSSLRFLEELSDLSDST